MAGGGERRGSRRGSDDLRRDDIPDVGETEDLRCAVKVQKRASAVGEFIHAIKIIQAGCGACRDTHIQPHQL